MLLRQVALQWKAHRQNPPAPATPSGEAAQPGRGIAVEDDICAGPQLIDH